MDHTSETVTLDNQEIGWHVWQPKATKGPLIVVFHGFLAHGRYPTVRYAAELCATQLPGSTVVAADMPGHGTSTGLRGYLPGGADGLIRFGCQVLATVCSKYQSNDNTNRRKVFLVGSSMGGTIALHVARKEPPGSIDGVVLLAPMLKLAVSSVEETALACLAMLVPTWKLIPSSSTSSEKQYRAEEKRKECEEDALAISGSKICVGSALTCVQLARMVTEAAPTQDGTWTRFPLWIGVADQDAVVDKTGSLDLHQQISEAGGACTAMVYPALHGLLCEPSPLFEQITQDLLSWLKEKL